MTGPTTDGEEGSELPPSKRDINSLDAVIRTQGRNDRALSQGFAQGRLVQARLVSDTAESEEDYTGGEGEPADDTNYEWQWEDRHTITATGTQVAHLTHYPIEESLFVRWHPDGIGGLPVTNEHFDLDIEARTVTILDPGIFQEGDEFSFQYQFNPGIEEPYEPVVLRGVTFADEDSTEILIPTGTLEGDTLVLMLSSATGFSPIVFSDPRFPDPALYETVANISSMVRIGTDDGTGDPVPVTIIGIPAGTYGFAILASFSPFTVEAPASTTDVSPPYTFDPVSAIQALGFAFSYYNVVPGSLTNDSTDGWDTIAMNGSGGTIGMFLFNQDPPVVGTTPPGELNYTGVGSQAEMVSVPIYAVTT